MKTNKKQTEKTIIQDGPGLLEVVGLLAEPSCVSNGFFPRAFRFQVKIGKGKIPHTFDFRLDTISGLSLPKDSNREIKMLHKNIYGEESLVYTGTYNFVTKQGSGEIMFLLR